MIARDQGEWQYLTEIICSARTPKDDDDISKSKHVLTIVYVQRRVLVVAVQGRFFHVQVNDVTRVKLSTHVVETV